MNVRRETRLHVRSQPRPAQTRQPFEQWQERFHVKILGTSRQLTSAYDGGPRVEIESVPGADCRRAPGRLERSPPFVAGDQFLLVDAALARYLAALDIERVT